VREVVGNNQTEAAFLFGHELGHHWLHHFDASDDASRVQVETEADEMGGCAVARLNADFLAMQGLIFRIRSEQPDGSYPDQAASLAAARAGFARCGGVRGTGPRFASRTAGPTLLGASLIMETEGFAAEVVRIPGSSGGYIGYGHAVTAEEIARGEIQIYGATIDLSRGITEAQALLLLYDDMRPFTEGLNHLIEVPLTDPQRAALESFVMNVGLGGLRNSALLQSINEGDYEAVPRLMARWTGRGGPAIAAALQRRRDREIGMWLAGSATSQEGEPAPDPTPP
jgi:GH24 family phage-related lysozyme (muramidase)